MGSLRLPDVVAVDRVAFILVEQLDAVGRVGPSLEVAHATGVGRDDFQNLSFAETVDGLLRLDDGHRAALSFHVQRLSDIEFRAHSWVTLGLSWAYPTIPTSGTKTRRIVKSALDCCSGSRSNACAKTI